MLESVIFTAIIVERLTEWFFGTPFEKVEKLKGYRWLLMYISAAIGILAALSYQLDLFILAGQPITLVGKILTGVAVGGGANLVHDLVAGLGGRSLGIQIPLEDSDTKVKATAEVTPKQGAS